ncbi:MAG: glucosaminidase domain-containing protein, partial [Cyclobacteriaceae bacterium]
MNLRPGYSFVSLLALLLLTRCENNYVLQITHVQVDSLSQIVLLQDTLVQPIVYTHIRGLEHQPVPKAKALFVSSILPSILIAKYLLAEKKDKVHQLKAKKRWTPEDSTYYHELKSHYKARDLENLLRRMSTLPNSIILAQAAVESGWGQSRFFREGNNVFGMWSYNSNEPRLRASNNREDKTIHVRAYEDISGSITDYFKTLGTARAYRKLREVMQQTDDPALLLPHLKY